MSNWYREQKTFLCKDGPAKATDLHCNKKLCLASTDLDLLINLLEKFVTLEDCLWVKYSEKGRGGIYFARAFFNNKERIGKLWAKFKLHPKLICNIQDDDFSKPYREFVQRWEDRDPNDIC